MPWRSRIADVLGLVHSARTGFLGDKSVVLFSKKIWERVLITTKSAKPTKQ